ncbi:MAG: uracil-DNA glycosylase family protein [Sulfurimonas sp.]|uniref:uracil-DNA glycosylase family protein n=1 Tax=Sulfurimonas sp. TaxID=2022749 RepID=UPI0025F20595|nr:uracil-DNA glycosylase family protein [Sulfurimonas sp.]MCK9454519.1 uracil-DNA glycosylase family protein [Sulfurimonas sp.]
MKSPFKHYHPYDVFLDLNTQKVIVGTLPPPRFSMQQLKPQDVDFCYGSQDNLLWQALNRIYDLDLLFDNSKEAVAQRKAFLIKKRIGICDIVDSCERYKIDASDIGIQNVVLRDLVGFIKTYKNIHTLIFTGGGSKNGPEFFFKQQLKTHELKLQKCADENLRKHTFTIDSRVITTYSLISPSNAANRSIGANPTFKQKRAINPNYSTLDFRVEQYEKIFNI